MGKSVTAQYTFLELLRNEAPGYSISGSFQTTKSMIFKCPNGHTFNASASRMREFVKSDRKVHLCKNCKSVERMEIKLMELEGTDTCEYDILSYENTLVPATFRHKKCGKTFSMYPNVMYGKKKGFTVCLICHEKEYAAGRVNGKPVKVLA